MNTLCKAANQMLEVADANQYAVANQAPHGDVMAYNAAVNNLRTALEQEEEASAWLAERKEHWRKEREKAQATKDQDPELSAALGWPGGISDPVLDRTLLLQMVAELRSASQQALEALEKYRKMMFVEAGCRLVEGDAAITALRSALAQQAEPTLTIERLRDALVASRIIPPAAVEDPDEYDDGVTLHRIEALHRRIA